MSQDYNQELAQQFVGKIIDVKPHENCWIEYCGPKAKLLADACAEVVTKRGGYPYLVDSSSATINREIVPLDSESLTEYGASLLQKMQAMQKYIRISDDADRAKIALTGEPKKAYKTAMTPHIEYRVNNTRWMIAAAPTEEFAAACGMSFPEFKTFYRNVCLTDYGKMTEAAAPLQKIMTEGKKVRIYSPKQDTDLTFELEGINAIPCTGTYNIPDGECFTAPAKYSANGKISFGKSNFDGERFESIKLRFEDGKIIEAEADTPERTKRLNEILDTPNARYIGEFAINFNPYIQHPTGNVLFDEKIDGGLHLAMGKSYDMAFNGNKSDVHWDMVQIQRPDYGGGEIWIDDVLIRKDGLFVLPELLALNPENLKGAVEAKLLPELATPPVAAMQTQP